MQARTVPYIPTSRSTVILGLPLSERQWQAEFYTAENVKRIKNFPFLLVGIITGVCSVFMFSNFALAFLLLLITAISLSMHFFGAANLINHLTQNSKKRQYEYRLNNAHVLIKALIDDGLSVIRTDGKPAAEIFATTDQPRLLDESGVQYRVNFIEWKSYHKVIRIMTFLDDDAVKESTQHREKQERMAFYAKQYQQENGPMSDEWMNGFTAALERVL